MKNRSGFSLVIGIAFLCLLAIAAYALEVGDAAPAISATDQDGKSLSFADTYKKGVTLVYFYPKADTPGCTAEACSLRDSYVDLQKKGLQIIGVSEDKAEDQKKFQEKYKLPFPLVADTDGSVAKAFGVPTVKGLAKRESFLIKNGKIAWLDLHASTSTQADDVGKAMENLK